MNKKMLLAYLAGAIDSDGTIGVKRSTYQMRVTKDSKQPTFSERIALRQVQQTIPDLLKNTFGGSLYITEASSKNGKDLWSWAATDMKAAEALHKLLPYLKIKKNQALNALRLRKVKEQSKIFRVRIGRGHVGSSSRSKRHSAAMERCYAKAKDLNRVGR